MSDDGSSYFTLGNSREKHEECILQQAGRVPSYWFEVGYSGSIVDRSGIATDTSIASLGHSHCVPILSGFGHVQWNFAFRVHLESVRDALSSKNPDFVLLATMEGEDFCKNNMVSINLPHIRITGSYGGDIQVERTYEYEKDISCHLVFGDELEAPWKVPDRSE